MSYEGVRPENKDLLTRARQGDRAAFSDLVRLHQDEVYTLALRLVADRDLAADISQEAFVRAWRALPKFRGEAKFSTWMHRITVNVAWTQRRKQRRHRTDPIDESFIEPVAETISPERAAESAAIRGRLRDALAALPKPTRTVVVLKDVYGWTHGEIAGHLDISVTAAKVRLHRGRKQLRDRLWPEVDADA
jgi:RNA polymerase sigma-70 factor (ECF subfamily)